MSITLQMSVQAEGGDVSNDERTAQLPSFPVRYAVNALWLEAKEAKNEFMILNLMAACFGFCWTQRVTVERKTSDGNVTRVAVDAWPSFKDARYDPIQFGVGVHDFALRNGWEQTQLYSEGTRVYDAMIAEVNDTIHSRRKVEEDFSEDQEATGTT